MSQFEEDDGEDAPPIVFKLREYPKPATEAPVLSAQEIKNMVIQAAWGAIAAAIWTASCYFFCN